RARRRAPPRRARPHPGRARPRRGRGVDRRALGGDGGDGRRPPSRSLRTHAGGGGGDRGRRGARHHREDEPEDHPLGPRRAATAGGGAMTVALVILLLILLNALFVAAEFAIIAAPRAAIEHKAAEGSKLARAVLGVLQDPRRQDRYIATAQIGITCASLGLGMYGEQKIAAFLEGDFGGWGVEAWLPAHILASVVAVGGLTYLHIVLGEMVPKTLALQHAEGSALWISTPMRWVHRALQPLVYALNGLGNLLLRLLGIRRDLRATVPSSEMLRFVIREGVQRGKLSPSAGTVLEELFEFGTLRAAEVMTPRVRIVGIEEGASPEELWRVVRSAHHTRYPVYRGTLDHVVGIVRVRDVLADL